MQDNFEDLLMVNRSIEGSEMAARVSDKDGALPMESSDASAVASQDGRATRRRELENMSVRAPRTRSIVESLAAAGVPSLAAPYAGAVAAYHAFMGDAALAEGSVSSASAVAGSMLSGTTASVQDEATGRLQVVEGVVMDLGRARLGVPVDHEDSPFVRWELVRDEVTRSVSWRGLVRRPVPVEVFKWVAPQVKAGAGQGIRRKVFRILQVASASPAQIEEAMTCVGTVLVLVKLVAVQATRLASEPPSWGSWLAEAAFLE